MTIAQDTLEKVNQEVNNEREKFENYCKKECRKRDNCFMSSKTFCYIKYLKAKLSKVREWVNLKEKVLPPKSMVKTHALITGYNQAKKNLKQVIGE